MLTFLRSYIPRLILCAVLFILSIYIGLTWTPTIRDAKLTDASLQKPFIEDQKVPVTELFIFSFALPTVMYSLVTLPTFSLAATFAVTVASLESNFITMVVTDVIKYNVGRERPFFAEVCEAYNETLLPEQVCTGNRTSLIEEARLSFPSGHSSLSFSSAVLTSLLMLSLWMTQWSTAPVSFTEVNSLLLFLLPFIPLACSTYIAVTRITDYWHHFSDVLGGALLGTGIAAIIFTMRLSKGVGPAASGTPESRAAAAEYGTV